MKIYLSGPISNRPIADAEFDFNMAQIVLELKGYEVINPLKIPDRAHFTWAEYMLDDLKHLSGCEGIYMLPGCQHSRGCRVEYYFALGAGLQIYGSRHIGFKEPDFQPGITSKNQP